jgi:hypothetical protein
MAWGILAMLMRFVPYVGSFIAAAPPLAVSDPGWTMVLSPPPRRCCLPRSPIHGWTMVLLTGGLLPPL